MQVKEENLNRDTDKGEKGGKEKKAVPDGTASFD